MSPQSSASSHPHGQENRHWGNVGKPSSNKRSNKNNTNNDNTNINNISTPTPKTLRNTTNNKKRKENPSLSQVSPSPVRAGGTSLIPSQLRTEINRQLKAAINGRRTSPSTRQQQQLPSDQAPRQPPPPPGTPSKTPSARTPSTPGATAKPDKTIQSRR